MSTFEPMHDLPVLDELGERLTRAMLAAERAEQRPVAITLRNRRNWRPLLIAAVLFVILAGTAAAATLLVLRGSVIPAPARENLQPPMTVVPGTAKLAGVTAKDPADTRTWSVRTARSEGGQICVTAGELRDGQLGITGLDQRFRTLADGFADGCGVPGAGRSAFVGARVFDAPKRADVRTVVDGYGGSGLKTATLTSVSGNTSLPVSDDGVFVGVVRGYPEDSGVGLKLTFDNGKTETHNFTTSETIAPDTAGAVNVEGFQIGGFNSTICVRLSPARQVAPFFTGPVICGNRRNDIFFAARRLDRGARGGNGFTGWHWQHAPRTILYGRVRGTVKELAIDGPGGTRALKPSAGGNFLAVYPAGVDPKQLTLVARLRDGTVLRKQVESGLVPFPRVGHR